VYTYIMKKSILFFGLLAMFAFTSCEKSSDNPENKLIGTWHLAKVTGGFSGAGYAAKFDQLKFSATKMEMAKGASILDTRSYSINASNDTLRFATENATADAFLFQGTKKIEFTKDKMILSDPCCDLYNYEFDKTNN
nr:hypothetical protein [Saprospiraceae bacterium]